MLKRVKTLILGLVFALLTGCACIVDNLQIYETNNPNEVYSHIAEVKNDLAEAHSGMLIFPEQESYYENTYFYDENYGLSTKHQVYNIKQYSESEFENEKRRLLLITEDGKHSYYNEDEFSYPAVVTAYDYPYTFEYALLDEKNYMIIYVCHTFVENWDFLDEEFRPLNYENLEEKKGIHYSIY